MKMCKELEDAIRQVCDKSNESEEIRNILMKVIQNSLDGNVTDEEVPTLIEKMVVDDEN